MTIELDPTTTGSSILPEPASKSFIEVQFPVSKLSKESYKERKAVAGQTLTALGKWWGRKPLVLARAIVLGLLLPATDDPEKDREIFLALMTMDDDGLWRRLDGTLPVADVYRLCRPSDRNEFFTNDGGRLRWTAGLSSEDKRRVQRRAFLSMSYDHRLEFCKRPEEIDGPSPDAWKLINTHLGTGAASLPEIIRELGESRFGRLPRVGDVFSGGGSIPFEAARLGCEAYGSDLNPVAGLLTWGALNVVGGGSDVIERIERAQQRVFNEVQQQVDAWRIERNEEGWAADAYLYCNEVLDPATGWHVPLAPSWVIAPKKNVIARLVPDYAGKRFEIEVVEGVSAEEMVNAAMEGTASDGVRSPVDRMGNWLPVSQRQATSIEQLRGRGGLRRWENNDLVPRMDDVFQERLYCIRWVETIVRSDGSKTIRRHYRAPTQFDLEREGKVLELLKERFLSWQANGIIPSRGIESGEKTEEPIRTRGWMYWHHLFNPRQLLLAGLFAEGIAKESGLEAKALLLMFGRLIDANSRLSRWKSGQGGGIGGGIQTFYNQALNTLVNYSCRPMTTLESAFSVGLNIAPVNGPHTETLCDARTVDWNADIWITDPGYGDVILYDELSEFFLAWYDKRLLELFPGWYSDSKRALTVKGEGEQFRTVLAECYKQLAAKMADDGFQVVMFTHQDPEVWADVALVLWAAGLQVTAAWTIATETGATGIKQGNYVQGTVILVLRKRRGNQRGDMSDLYPDIQSEVNNQLQTMIALDPKDDPNFTDADYQLAAYAAALRVLTGYSAVDEIDVDKELRRTPGKNERSPLVKLIGQAVKFASDALVPEGLERSTWRKLGPEERLYLKGVSVEAHGETREGVYQEMARSYGAGNYREMLASRAANKVRLKTPSEFAARDLRGAVDERFAGSLLRQTLFAIYKTATDPNGDPRGARQYLKQELPDYWSSRQTIMELLRYLANETAGLEHWKADVAAARLLLGSLEGDSL
jgi:adenine-specific DNA methylase